MSTDLQEVKFKFEQLCWLIERTDTVEQLILLKEVCAGFQFKEEEEDEMTQHEAVEFSNIQDDWNDKKTEDEKIICVDCHRDFTDECDGRSSFDEIGKIQCENCFLKEK